MKYLRIVCFLPLLIIISCFTNNIVKDPTVEKEGAVKKEKASQPPFVPGSEFTLGPGDEFTINVWRHDDLKRDVQVDPSGNIYFPLVGEIKASGLNISQLREEITLQLSKYFNSPNVDINVSNLKSQKIHVFGEVRSPGTFGLDPDMFAWEAISKAGGFTTDANKKKVLLVRNKDGIATVGSLNIHDMLKKGKITQNAYLRNGDILYVTPSFIANVGRFMGRFYDIINPLVTLERGIVLYPDVEDILGGKETGGSVLIAP